MKRRSHRRSFAFPAMLLVAGFLLAAAAWQLGWIERYFPQAPGDRHSAPVGRVDAANEGRRVQVSGRVAASAPARDPQLGISVDAALLFRDVEMYQWREACAGADCRYETAWSALAIKSAAFRQPQGHENPAPRLKSARFAGGELRVGEWRVDPGLVAPHLQTQPHAVHAADLPPNLAVTFVDDAGGLYAGPGDPQHPHVGALRVRFRAAAFGDVAITGVQRGDRLAAR
jgi:hypothetical protein